MTTKPDAAALDTPMMRQYQRMKAEAGEAILFFRMGDFYEMFHDDAVVASKALELTLTARGKDTGSGYPMCGVPHHAAPAYVARLVKRGFRVAICDQVEDPKQAKGLVRREIVRIVTPGTATDERGLGPDESSFVTAVLLERGRIGLAHVDVATGEFRFSEHDPETERQGILTELATFAPRELLVPEGADERALGSFFPGGALPPITPVEAWTFDRQQAVDLLVERFRVAGVGAWGLEGRPAATRAAGAALAYLEHTQKTRLPHLEPPRRVESRSTVVVDPTTRRNLEVVESLRDGARAGSLLAVLDRTRSALGGRTLRSWLLAPLAEVAPIEERLDAVEELVGASNEAEDLGTALERVADLERLLSRTVLGSANARDLSALRVSLEALPELKSLLGGRTAGLLRSLGGALDLMPELRDELARGLAEEPPATLRDGGMIRAGYSAELDELQEIARDGRAWLLRLEASERERTGITSLKVRHNRVFGYYLEVSKSNLAKVPDDYHRKQTLATGERFVTPELKEMEGKILGARDRAVTLETELFTVLRQQVADQADALRATARALGAVDALLSLASVAHAHSYVRPRLDEGRDLIVRGGRHPVVERMAQALAGPGLGDGRFVPNDTDLAGDEAQLYVLTGPNMGGKSTYLRQVALIALMAQAGSFVPADEARIGLVDKIFTRVGASDSLATGQSTFMVEMSETARILHEATPKSLLVLDEIGRGTATFDGLSIAWAVAEYLHETAAVAARTLFATHYHELTELALLYPRVRNLRMATREWNDEIVFLHRVEPGAGDRSYGIQVARLAGLPRAVVERAREILQNLEKNDLDPSGRPKLAEHHEGRAPARPLAARPPAARPGPATVSPQLPLFGVASEDPRLRALADRVSALDPDDLSPRQALELLADLAAQARAALR